jgi:hypothetical protein
MVEREERRSGTGMKAIWEPFGTVRYKHKH